MKPANYPQNPASLWNIFYDFTQTPRPSKKEEKIREYLINLAKDNQLEYKLDQAQNVIIYVPGKNGRENDEPVIIQNHVDMVTDSLKGVEVNFVTDPIKTEVNGEWLKAVGTTLGADNGIGCAAALAPIFEKDLKHPPLELLFTMDEETGLNGALNLESKYLTAKKMLNLDTEEWGSLYIGCAGGIDYEFTKTLTRSSASSDRVLARLEVENFIGGHSGVDIHEQRGNALKFLIHIISEFNKKSQVELELSELRGGRAHNIIPREAFVELNILASEVELLESIINEVSKSWRSFLPKKDHGFITKLSCEESSASSEVITGSECQKLVNFLDLFPHGVHSLDLETNGVVGTSNNLARVLIVRDQFYLQTSLRFFDREEIKKIENQITLLAKISDIEYKSDSEYPSWKPQAENSVLETVKKCYKDLYKSEPEVTAIHAGLECGILRDKIGELDVVSFGPTITGAHSPDEQVNIPSVEKFWELYKEVLAKI